MTAFELLGDHDPDTIVAFGDAGTKTAADLLSDAARISRALPPAFDGSQVLLVFEKDRYAMAAAFLAALDRGHAVALPPNGRRDSVLAVHERPETAIVLHDTEAGFPLRVPDLLELDGERAERMLRSGESAEEPSLVMPIVPREGVIATVYTSGTTGPMTPCRKTSAELLGEAEGLARTFDVVPGDRIVGAVAPGHIYGLLFTILLPLMRGASFSRETPHHASAVAHCVGTHRASILVSVPVQLRAFGALAGRSLAQLRRVFSSTGPLPDSVARDFHERHGLAVTEIFGSTETGGIAWRMRFAGDPEPWQPFPGVQVSVGETGRLRVDSPFLHPELTRPFETGDLIEPAPDGGFIHLGRADGIVKIGGRRVRIQEVEDGIRKCSGVEDAAVLAVPAPAGRGHRLLAAIVPVPDPKGAAEAEGALLSDVKAVLLEKFEPTCLPRRMVCVDALPKEANGKVPRERLLRLFGMGADGRPANWRLAWGESSRPEGVVDGLECPVDVPPDYAWFEGHFEDYPVLAGAVQLKELILPMVARAFPELGRIESMSRIKFTGRIVPGDRLLVRVERRPAKRTRVVFEIRKQGEVCSRGILTLAAHGTDAVGAGRSAPGGRGPVRTGS
ncbi:MAG TPA: hypothetical protein ENI85_00580 [Deltaproteobacteria bacterium]|nr:hypothetical protein [Deltaproteobacteria bacterium]